jgi:hypothetical protein
VATLRTEPDLPTVITPNDEGWAAYLPGPTHGAGRPSRPRSTT